MINHPSNMTLFASPDCPEAVDDAKKYIKLEGYDATTVKIVKVDGMLLVKKR